MTATQTKLTDVLLEEHRMIESALVVLARFAAHIRRGGEPHPEVIDALLRFFTEFVEGVHQGKEEELLLPWMHRNGVPSEIGPLHRFQEEHQELRDLFRHLSTAGRHAELISEDARSFAGLAERLCVAFTRHMRREEESLFPMAEQLGEGNDGLFSWEDGLTQTMHQEHGELLRRLEHAAEAWPIEDVRWETEARA